jgi:hypothetical protein
MEKVAMVEEVVIMAVLVKLAKMEAQQYNCYIP